MFAAPSLNSSQNSQPLLQFLKIAVHLRDFTSEERAHLVHAMLLSRGHQVNCNSSQSKPPCAPDAMEIGLHVHTSGLEARWHLVVHNQRYLWHIDPSGQDVCGNQDSCHTRSELIHDLVAQGRIHPLFSLRLRSADERYTMPCRLHALRQRERLLPLVHKDNALTHVHGRVKLRELIKLVILIFADHVHLLNARDGEVSLTNLDGDCSWDQVLRKFSNVIRVGCTEEQHLNVGRKKTPDLRDLRSHLILLVQHHVSFVKYKNSDH
mmetsp:Transcript_87255/g.154590  ORF Transcript_87255/g.154590 Transcript_87255/m.154590 type:complete len:265 (-) Transcript_87255:783-1577(-)